LARKSRTARASHARRARFCHSLRGLGGGCPPAVAGRTQLGDQTALSRRARGDGFGLPSEPVGCLRWPDLCSDQSLCSLVCIGRASERGATQEPIGSRVVGVSGQVADKQAPGTHHRLVRGGPRLEDPWKKAVVLTTRRSRSSPERQASLRLGGTSEVLGSTCPHGDTSIGPPEAAQRATAGTRLT